MTDPAPELDVTHVRQARRGRHALMILIWSTALGLVAMALVWAFYAGPLSGAAGNGQAPAQVAASTATQASSPSKAGGG
jgi:hypothetical protein